MSLFSRASTIRTDRTALIRCYPWSHGVPLLSDRHSFLSDAWKETRHAPTLIKMALDLAELVDFGTEFTVNDPNTYDALSTFLGNEDAPVENARQSIIARIKPEQSIGNVNLIVAAEIVFRYRLLDLFADVLGAPQPEQFSVLPRISSPSHSVLRLDMMMVSLRDWPKVVDNFCRLHKAYIRNQMAVDAPSPPSLQNNAQRVFNAGLQCLIRSHRCTQNKQYEKVMLNMESLAYCIWWICMGFDTLPNDETSMLESLSHRAKALDMPEESYNCLPALVGEMKDLVKIMRNTFYLAVAISPLVALLPRKLQLDSIRRDVLIGHALAIGNEKPMLLRDVEKAIWFCAFHMAADYQTETQVPELVKKIEGITALATVPEVVEWFCHKNNEVGQDGHPQPPSSQVNTGPSTAITPPTQPTSGAVDAQQHEQDNVAHAESSSDSSTDTSSESENDEAFNSATHLDPHPDNDNAHPPDTDGDESDAHDSNPQVNPANDSGDASQNEDDDVTSDQSDRQSSPTWQSGDGNRRGRQPRNQPLERAKITQVDSDHSSPERTVTVRPRRARAPDLPLVFPQVPKRNLSDMVSVPAEKISNKGIKAKMFFILPNVPPKRYEFKVSEKMAPIEHVLFSKIQKSVENCYIDGRPRHHHPSARVRRTEHGSSQFFVTSAEEFAELSGEDVQAIFRDRHILIPAGTSRTSSFSRQGLAQLGSLYAPRDIQLNSQSASTEFKKSSHCGRLLDLLPDKDRKIVTGLSAPTLPMTASSMPKPPHYSDLASTEYAWQQTRDIDGMMNVGFPSDGMVWASASTRDATSWVKIHDHGMAAVLTVVAGLTYFVTMFPEHADDNAHTEGDLGSATAFGQQWSPYNASDDIWDHEGVLLAPGDILYMRPTTPHYVLTVEDSIIHGRHIFPASSIQRTSFGIVHCFIMNTKVTNAVHDNLFTLLRRLMAVWYSHYNEGRGANTAPNVHVPDISTVTGLTDLMAIGNLLELSPVLDRRAYRKGGVLQAEQQEMAVARWWYRKLQVLFATQHVTHVGGNPASPLSIFRRSLVEFAAGVVVYKQDMDMHVPRIHGCSPSIVSRKMTELFKANYPELLPALEKRIENDHKFLYWTGPPITIRIRDPTQDRWSIRDDGHINKRRPRLDFADSPTFLTGELDVRRPSPRPRYKRKEQEGNDLDLTKDVNVDHEDSTSNPVANLDINVDTLEVSHDGVVDGLMNDHPLTINPALLLASNAPTAEQSQEPSSSGAKRSLPAKRGKARKQARH